MRVSYVIYDHTLPQILLLSLLAPPDIVVARVIIYYALITF